MIYLRAFIIPPGGDPERPDVIDLPLPPRGALSRVAIVSVPESGPEQIISNWRLAYGPIHRVDLAR